jgi:inorganic pyrophosphatase
MPASHDDPQFWITLEQFVVSSELVVDRPKGSAHSRFPEIIYPLDCGFLTETNGGGNEGVDVWIGTQKNWQITGVAYTADPFTGDAVLKILLGCSSADFATLEHFFQVVAELPASIVPRGKS